MRLSWNEVRARAGKFADDWRDAAYEKGETQSFYNDFFEVFGVRRRSVARYEEHVTKLNDRSGYIDLFWPRVLIVEQKSAGRDLERAYGQAGEYFDALRERDRPRFVLLSDFQTFELHDLDERTVVEFALPDLPAHVESFGFILGVQRRTFRDQDPANMEAAELVGRLHDALADAGHRGHDLERFLVRVVFCMFADDTLRTTNPIESVFATVRHRTIGAKGCLSHATAVAMVFMLITAAARSWWVLEGKNQLPKLIKGVKFRDGIEMIEINHNAAA